MATKLSDFVLELQQLVNEGHGEKEVYMIDSRSGCAVALFSARVDNYIGEAGPFDLKGDEYISITGGH